MTITTEAAPILAALTFLDGLVRQIGPERIVEVTTRISGSFYVHPVDRQDGHRIVGDLVASGATLTETTSGLHDDPRAAYTAYHLDVEGYRVTVFASPTRTVFEAARVDGHSEACAGRQHMAMTSRCTCGRGWV